MFFLDELEKMLDALAKGGPENRDLQRLRITLPDIERVDVEQMQLSKKVRYPPGAAPGAPSSKQFYQILEDRLKLNPQSISTDTIFGQFIDNLLLKRLELMPKREYPYAKLIICDQYSYDLLIKLKRIVSLQSSGSKKSSQNFIHEAPLNVTAIFHLDDIVNAFSREQEPIIQMTQHRAIKRPVASFNYNLVRKVFPSLRMSDLILLVREKGNLRLGTVVLKSDNNQLVIQLLSHYARSTQLLELYPIDKSLGFLHYFYDNVLIFKSIPLELREDDSSGRSESKMTLPKLSSMVQRLFQVASRFRLKFTNITYRIKDPLRQTKAFAEIVKINIDPKKAAPLEEIPAKVLVLDRGYDLQAFLWHADTYGAFLDQERPVESSGMSALSLKYDTWSELDARLAPVPLTEVLSSILNYALSLRPEDVKEGKGKKYVPSVNKSLLSAMTTSQSIRRHLDIVKYVYKCLNEGYLLVLKLEFALEEASNELRNLKEPLPQEKQDQLAGRLNRIFSAFKQLTKISRETISVEDILRSTCILMDVINLFLSIHDNDTRSSINACRSLHEIRSSILQGNDFRATLKIKIENEQKTDIYQLQNQLINFDKLSKSNCANRCAYTLEQIVERFAANQLDANYFASVGLAPEINSVNERIFVLVFLGTITPRELAKIKTAEALLKQTGKVGDFLIIANSMEASSYFLTGLR